MGGTGLDTETQSKFLNLKKKSLKKSFRYTGKEEQVIALCEKCSLASPMRFN